MVGLDNPRDHGQSQTGTGAGAPGGVGLIKTLPYVGKIFRGNTDAVILYSPADHIVLLPEANVYIAVVFSVFDSIFHKVHNHADQEGFIPPHIQIRFNVPADINVPGLSHIFPSRRIISISSLKLTASITTCALP